MAQGKGVIRQSSVYGRRQEGRTDLPGFLQYREIHLSDLGLTTAISTTSLQQRQADGVHDGHRAGWLLQSAGLPPGDEAYFVTEGVDSQFCPADRPDDPGRRKRGAADPQRGFALRLQFWKKRSCA